MRVSLYGAGQVNRGVAGILGAREGYEVIGPCGREERDTAIRSGADCVVIATTSFLAEIADDIRDAIAAGSNVITTAEEAAYPAAVDPELARELDKRARAAGVTVVGAGLNPGYAFDALVLTATGYAWSVDGLRIERDVDLSGFSATILRRLGIAYSLQDFEAGVAGGTIFGHIGFPQSMRTVGDRLGVEIERIDRAIEPIIAGRDLAARHLEVPEGTSAGFVQRDTAIVGGEPWFEAIFTGHVELSEIGRAPRDEIVVRGETPVRFVIDPGFNPQIGSCGVIANSIRRVVAAPPGWLTVAELPPAYPR